MDGGVRKGPLRELIVDGMELDPSEGSTPTIVLSGYSGDTHVSGNGVYYGEASPHAGRLEQDVSVDSATLKKLQSLQSSGRFVSVTATDSGNRVYDGKMRISNDDGLEADDGDVSLSLKGSLRPRR